MERTDASSYKKNEPIPNHRTPDEYYVKIVRHNPE